MVAAPEHHIEVYVLMTSLPHGICGQNQPVICMQEDFLYLVQIYIW